MTPLLSIIDVRMRIFNVSCSSAEPLFDWQNTTWSVLSLHLLKRNLRFPCQNNIHADMHQPRSMKSIWSIVPRATNVGCLLGAFWWKWHFNRKICNWRHIRVMASQIPDILTVCSTACYNTESLSLDLREKYPSVTGGLPSQRATNNAESVSMSWRDWLSLQWRHNGRHSVSNHQTHECLLNRLFERRSKKTSKLRVTGLCAGNSPGTGEFPAQMASNEEMFPFDDVIMSYLRPDRGLAFDWYHPRLWCSYN